MVAPGTRIRVVGQAFHPEGITSITIGGQPAELSAGVGGVVDFQGYVTTVTGLAEVYIVASPRRGEPILRRFAVAINVEERRQPQPVLVAAPAPRYSPGGAALRSLLLPGLGQFYTGRPVLGVLFAGTAAGAAAAGLVATKTTVRCLSALSGGKCPTGQTQSETIERPYLVAGVGAAVGIAVVAAIEAYTAASNMNQRTGSAARPPARLDALEHGILVVEPSGSLRLGLRITP